MSYVLTVGSKGVELLPSSDLSGLGNYEAMDRLRKKYGRKIGITSIGQAGEIRLNAATIAVSDLEGFPNRHSGRRARFCNGIERAQRHCCVVDGGRSSYYYFQSDSPLPMLAKHESPRKPEQLQCFPVHISGLTQLAKRSNWQCVSRRLDTIS